MDNILTLKFHIRSTHFNIKTNNIKLALFNVNLVGLLCVGKIETA